MAQANINLPNSDGMTYRNNNNDALEAMATGFSGATTPTTTFPFMTWVDTTDNVLKRRNETNSQWVIMDSLPVGKVDSKTATYTVLAGDMKKTLLIDSSGGNVVINLPYSDIENGFEIGIKKISNDSNTITIMPNLTSMGSGVTATIDGAANLVISSENDVVRLISNGVNWYNIVFSSNSIHTERIRFFIRRNTTRTITYTTAGVEPVIHQVIVYFSFTSGTPATTKEVIYNASSSIGSTGDGLKFFSSGTAGTMYAHLDNNLFNSDTEVVDTDGVTYNYGAITTIHNIDSYNFTVDLYLQRRQ